MLNLEMTINAQAVRGERSQDVVNPATEEIFARVTQGDASHVNLAVAAARAAFPSWSKTTDAERKRLLNEVADAIEAHMSELMELLTKESGKPLVGLNHVGSGMEVMAAIAWTRAATALDLPVEVIQDNEEARVEVHRKAIGVVGSISPWNWPLMIAIWHIAPALRAGNTVVLKPSEYTPVSTLRFVQIANTILPPGVLNIVTGAGDVGAAIASHPDIDKIVFTGSTPTGKRVMEMASANFKRLTLELGGNDAGIVLADVDPKKFAPQIFGAAFHNNGQTCACLKRLYVHESIYEQLCHELAELAKNTVVGDGLAEGTQLGPLQNARQLGIVRELVEDSRQRGARILAGGSSLPGKGFFFAPTIVADAKDGMPLVDEEQFGPALPVISYRDLDEVILRANKNPNGLGGSIWTEDLKRAADLAPRLECGTVWVNTHGAVQPDAPFGGVKQSGLGVEFGRHGLEEFTSIQTVKIMKG